ncbi:MAG: DUF4148 domain-containing protein [Rubrivivax sp.]|nr:DUF4148 domain-containing protein [Rubrivivax sp.]
MNTRMTILAATLAALASGAALAQEATYDYPTAGVGTVTRADVQAELAQARRDGSMRVWSTSYNHMAAAKSLKSRDDVRAEVLAERRAIAGTLTSAAIAGEDSGSFALSRQPLRQAAGLTVAAR